MSKKFAIKKLTQSDLTLFAYQNSISDSNQKAINLNADVLKQKLYPTLDSSLSASPKGFPVTLTLIGPSNRGPITITRKIIRGGSYKNWRLNGEIVSNPPSDTTRFDSIIPGDLAVLIFEGELYPTSVTICFISSIEPSDLKVFQKLSPLVQSKSMVSIEEKDLVFAVTALFLPEDDFLFSLTNDEEAVLEDVISGSDKAVEKINKRGRKVSREELLRVQQKRDLTGQLGENLVNNFLYSEQTKGKITAYIHTAQENVVSPFDFEVHGIDEEIYYNDVKTTVGEFARPFHISSSEVFFAARSEHPYYIFRVYEASYEIGILRISEDIRPLARHIVESVQALANESITIDSFSVHPKNVEWSEPVQLEMHDYTET